MQWREKLVLLLGAASPFALGQNTSAYADADPWHEHPKTSEAHKDLLVFVDPAQRGRLLLLAGHRSHSSHSSHSSHVSGSSGHSSHYSGSTYTAPVYSPPATVPKPKPAPKSSNTSQGFYTAPSTSDDQPEASASAEPTTTTEAKRFTKDELNDIVQKVQIALIVRGFDPGPVDGVYSAKMKTALGEFQAANNLPVTHLMDLKTLKLLNVVP